MRDTHLPSHLLTHSIRQPWWGGCFIISFNIPYYGITTRELQDCRTISGGGDRLRNRHDLGFLHLQDYGMSDGESSPFHDNPVLHQLMFSFMSTGKSNEYCTAACLDDDVFGDDLGEEPRLASEEEVVGSSDPILHKAELDFTLLPRSYALEALKTGLHKVVEHQENILDWFRASISRHVSQPFLVSAAQVHICACRTGCLSCSCSRHCLTLLASLDFRR